MEQHSLKDDLKMLELGREHMPRFSKDTTEKEARDILDNLKRVVAERRDSLIKKYQAEVGDNEEKLREINEAADRIFSL